MPLGPIAGAYYLDNSRVAVIEGPVGSGKTTASCLRIQRHAYEQIPSPDGIGKTRFAVVRNTKPQLKDTTIRTWLNVFPEAVYGQFRRGDALDHTWKFQPQGHPWPIETEIIFRALDDAADVQNLLSLEVTGFYFNEVREIDQEIIAHAGRRTRYLGGDRPCTWSGWIGDTNPWDTEHYLQDRLVDNPREGWAHFQQPGGMDENAENLDNLEQTDESRKLPFGDPRRREQGRQYYIKALQDYSPEDAAIYVHARRGVTRTGKPIYSDYLDTVHCKPFELDSRLPIQIGYDFGRTPAAVIGQHTVHGWKIRHELCAFGMGIKQHGFELKKFLAEKLNGYKVSQATGDPSGVAQDGDDRTAFDLLKASGLICYPASTNEPSIRVETVNGLFRQMNGGHPSLLIHPDCKMLRRACIDGYRFRKLNVSGNRYDEKPDKNDWSHVAEALQYLLLGGGEGKALMGKREAPANRPRYATM